MNATILGLGSRLIGEGQPCLVVAHVGAAHEGSGDTARRLIDAAFQAGADAIAFQLFRADELLVRRHPDRAEMEAVEIPAKEWLRVLEAARASGLAVVAEVLDVGSRDVAGEAGVDALQANARDLDHPELLRALAEGARPLLIGIGPAPERLVWEALDVAGESVALLVCPPATPAAVEELRLTGCRWVFWTPPTEAPPSRFWLLPSPPLMAPASSRSVSPSTAAARAGTGRRQ